MWNLSQMDWVTRDSVDAFFQPTASKKEIWKRQFSLSLVRVIRQVKGQTYICMPFSVHVQVQRSTINLHGYTEKKIYQSCLSLISLLDILLLLQGTTKFPICPKESELHYWTLYILWSSVLMNILFNCSDFYLFVFCLCNFSQTA